VAAAAAFLEHAARPTPDPARRARRALAAAQAKHQAGAADAALGLVAAAEAGRSPSTNARVRTAAFELWDEAWAVLSERHVRSRALPVRW